MEDVLRFVNTSSICSNHLLIKINTSRLILCSGMKTNRQSTIKEIKKHIPTILFFIFIAEIAFFVVGGIWHYLIGELFNFKYVKAVQNFGAFFSSLIVIFMMRIYLKEVYLEFISSAKLSLNRLILSFFSFIFVIISYTIAVYFFFSVNKLDVSINSVSFINETKFLFEFFIVQIILILAEEIINRGFLISLIVSKTKNKLVAIIFSSLVFAFGHFHYWFSMNLLMTIWIGIILAVLYIHFNSIYPPILFHIGWNLSNNFFLVNKNPLISMNYQGFLSPELIRLSILFLISIFLVIILRKEIIRVLKKIRMQELQPELEIRT